MNFAPLFRKLQSGGSITIVVYGTSLTAGGAWVEAMKSWWDDHFPGQVTLINSAGPGENSDWGVANFRDKVLTHSPDLVFLEFSYNDAHEKFSLPVERGASNLAQMVEELASALPESLLVLQTMNVGWDAPNGNRSASVRPHLQTYNDNYRRLAAERGLPLLDHSRTWQALKETDPERFRSFVEDGSHPTREGSLAYTWPTTRAFLESVRSLPADV